VSPTRQNVMPMYQGGAGILCNTKPINHLQIASVLVGIPNDTIRNIRVSERRHSLVANDPKNHHKFHMVVVIFGTCQLAYILLYQGFW
jgi:hypothetical protein